MVDVDATGIGSSEAGLGINLYSPTSTSPLDIFYAGYPSVYSNLQGVSGTHTTGGGPTITFEMTRVGTTMKAFFNNGSGFQQLNSATEWAGPAEVDLLFLTENGTTGATSTTFRNLVVTAASISGEVPEPATGWLLVPALGLVGLRTARRHTFKVER